MRDPKRIPRILDKLRKTWNAVPDWRFGQLVSNTASIVGDIFFLEDDNFEKLLDAEMKRMRIE